MRKVVLFASGPFGRDVAHLIRRQKLPVEAVVVAKQPAPENNNALMASVRPLARDERLIIASPRLHATIDSLLRSLNADLGLLAWWPYILPRSTLRAVQLGFLNIHPSYLPYNRGKDPNFWALKDQTPCGATIHWVDPGIDSGDIAFRTPLRVSWEDDGRTIYRRSQELCLRLLEQNMERIWHGNIPREPQSNGIATFHRRADLEKACRIELDAPITPRELLNLLRARTFPPRPGASFEDDGVEYEVHVTIRRRPTQPGPSG